MDDVLPPKSWAEDLANLRPGTKKWLLDRGYIELVTEDGETNPRITPKGENYFNGLYKPN